MATAILVCRCSVHGSEVSYWWPSTMPQAWNPPEFFCFFVFEVLQPVPVMVGVHGCYVSCFHWISVHHINRPVGHDHELECINYYWLSANVVHSGVTKEHTHRHIYSMRVSVTFSVYCVTLQGSQFSFFQGGAFTSIQTSQGLFESPLHQLRCYHFMFRAASPLKEFTSLIMRVIFGIWVKYTWLFTTENSADSFMWVQPCFVLFWH